MMSRDSLSFGRRSGWWRAIGLVLVWCAGLAALVGSGGGGGGGTGGGGTGTPSIAFSASTATFAGTVGTASPAAQGLTITNGGGGTLSGLVIGTITYSTGSGWLNATLNTGSAPATLTLQATTGSLAVGTYTASVSVVAPGASNTPASVAVTFNVTPVGALTVISGVADYESVPNNTTTGALVYGSITFRPIRLAAVDLVASPSGTVLASTTTNSAGAYSFTVTTPQSVLVRVRAEMVRTGATGGSYNFSVRDNTAGNALYTMDSPAFTPASGATTTRNLRAATGWGGSSYTGTRAAAPFSILDVSYETSLKVLQASPNAVFPALRLFWSVNNRPTSGSLTTGLIGTSFFQHSTTAGTHDIYILGAADTDTDEFDRHVVAHEWGHYIQAAFSRDDSLGGQHSGGNKLDMRVAFSEGWGNGWSGIAMGTPFYGDSFGTGQLQGFIINVSTAPTTNQGWFSESSVQYLIYQFGQNASIGFTPIFTVLANMRTTLLADGAVSSIHSFAARLKATVPSMASTINSLLAGQSITGTDAVGTGETNNGGVPEALPVYRNHTAALGVAQNYCVSDTAGVSGAENNKLGTHVFIRLTTSSAGARTITAIGTTSSSDPDFNVISSAGIESVFDAATTVSQSTTAGFSLPAGTHLIILNDYNLTANGATAAAQNGTRCFNVTVQ
jgi:hypothetical protein